MLGLKLGLGFGLGLRSGLGLGLQLPVHYDTRIDTVCLFFRNNILVECVWVLGDE